MYSKFQSSIPKISIFIYIYQYSNNLSNYMSIILPKNEGYIFFVLYMVEFKLKNQKPLDLKNGIKIKYIFKTHKLTI